MRGFLNHIIIIFLQINMVHILISMHIYFEWNEMYIFFLSTLHFAEYTNKEHFQFYGHVKNPHRKIHSYHKTHPVLKCLQSLLKMIGQHDMYHKKGCE